MRIFLLASIMAALAGCGAAPQEPLGRAAARGDLEELARLLQGGATPAERQSALVWAARYGQPAVISALVRRGADPNAAWGVNHWPVLMHAIHKNRLESVIALMESGADPNAGGGNGETPLMMAAGYGYTDIVRTLLNHGADARRALPGGETALDFAAAGVLDIDRFTWGRCQVETVRLLRNRVPGLAAKRDWSSQCGR
jgi:ankyrin repeat protein